MEFFFESFSQHGWWSIFAFALVLSLFLLFKYIEKKLTADVTIGIDKIAEKLTETTSEQNKILISSINLQNDKLLNIILESKRKEQDDHTNKLYSRIDSTETINLRLRDIGHKLKADRVAILEFHNTSQSLAGIPFAKYSCNFEWINRGAISLQAKCQSLPFSMISNIVRDIMISGNSYKVYENINEFIDTNSGLYAVLQECNTKSLIYNAIYNENNQIIGLMTLEYHYSIKESELDIHSLLVDTESISTILNLRHYK